LQFVSLKPRLESNEEEEEFAVPNALITGSSGDSSSYTVGLHRVDGVGGRVPTSVGGVKIQSYELNPEDLI
jgi:hypothetical protein